MDSSLQTSLQPVSNANIVQIETRNSLLQADDDGVITLSFLLLPEYAMMSLLSAIEPLRVANRLAGREIYRWQCLSEDGEPVYASNQMALQTHQNIHQVDPPRNIFVNSSFHPQRYVNEATVKWLRRLNRMGSTIGALDTGCHLLAHANLLKGYRITMHWEAVPVFQEQYPEQKISSELFEIDAKRITCAGGTAATDMVLHLIQSHCGVDLALQVCDQFIRQGIRKKSDKQRLALAHRLNIHNPRLLKVVALMEQHIAAPIKLSQLAERGHISLRQLERLFKLCLDCAPSQYYLRLRLNRAQQLLAESDLQISEIGLASGFNSTAHFCRSYRRHFGITANMQRQQPGL